MTETRTKRDLRRELAHLYRPSAKEVVDVYVPEMSFIMADGAGDPNTSEAFAKVVEALYAVSYTLKFTVRKEDGIDYGVMPLEGLWWTDGADAELEDVLRDRDSWRWTAMIMQPEWVTGERFGAAVASVERKKGLPGVSRLRFEAFHEGRAAQILHVGPFSQERPAIEKVERFIGERGGERRGRHHEIYLTDFRRTAPEKLKTIIRQPFG